MRKITNFAPQIPILWKSQFNKSITNQTSIKQ